MSKTISNQVSSKSIFFIALPLILQQLFYQMQIYVDRAMLGHVNSDYFSAIGNATVPFYTVWSVIIAVCGGTTIMIAQSIGAKDTVQAKGYAESSFIGNSILPITFFLIFFFAPEFIFELMGVQSPILEYSTSFMRIMSFSLLLLGIETTAASVLQGIGTTKVIMYAGLLRNALNIILDWLLIYGNLGFPRMDIEGAALATTLSNVLVAPFVIIYVMKSKLMPFKLELKNIIRVKWSLYKKVIQLGIPAGLESSLWNIGNLIVISYLNMVNIMAAGIYSLIFSLEIFPVIIYMGIARASMTLVGHKIGEDDQRQAVKIGFKCMGYSLAVCVLVSVVFILFPNELLGIFTNDTSIIEKTVPYLLLVSITMFPRAINNVVGLSIQGMGDTKWMLYGQIFGTIIMVGLSYVLIFVADYGIYGLFITFLLDEAIRAVINILRFWRGREFFFLRPFERIISSKSSVEEAV